MIMSTNLIKGDNPKLKQICKSVVIRKGIKIGKQLNKFFLTVPEAYGLAAPQVGILYRVFVMRFGGTTTVVIDPEITSFSRKKINMKEGCLSHPETIKDGINVKRSVEIIVSYYDGEGEPRNEILVGMRSIIFQHEVDHLNGICIVDK